MHRSAETEQLHNLKRLNRQLERDAASQLTLDQVKKETRLRVALETSLVWLVGSGLLLTAVHFIHR